MSEFIHVVIARYPNTDAAETALKKLQESHKNQGVQYSDAVVVRRGENSKLHIHETEDVTGTRGATVGGILGGVLGILAGPAGVVAGAAVGAMVGGATASLMDRGIPHKRLAEIGATLESGHAAVVVLTEEGFIPFIESMLSADGGEVATEAMDSKAAEELGHAHNTAVKALNMGEALANGGAVPVDETSE